MKCLNNEKRRSCRGNIYFEIYYGRKANELVHDGKCFPTDIETLSATAPKENDYRQQAKRLNN